MATVSFDQLCRARQLLVEPREAPLSIRDVAREARLSPFHFIRQFDALFGVTPHQFRIQSRIDRAKLLLANGELTVTEVCLEVGMSSLGSFSDLFARRVGVPPSDFRRRVLVPGFDPPFPGCLSLMALAFRNFQEAPLPAIPIQSTHANQAHQPDGRRPGQGTAVLHGNSRLPETPRDPRRAV